LQLDAPLLLRMRLRRIAGPHGQLCGREGLRGGTRGKPTDLAQHPLGVDDIVKRILDLLHRKPLPRLRILDRTYMPVGPLAQKLIL
jgi:hypothetical protein